MGSHLKKCRERKIRTISYYYFYVIIEHKSQFALPDNIYTKAYLSRLTSSDRTTVQLNNLETDL